MGEIDFANIRWIVLLLWMVFVGASAPVVVVGRRFAKRFDLSGTMLQAVVLLLLAPLVLIGMDVPLEFATGWSLAWLIPGFRVLGICFVSIEASAFLCGMIATGRAREWMDRETNGSAVAVLGSIGSAVLLAVGLMLAMGGLPADMKLVKQGRVSSELVYQEFVTEGVMGSEIVGYRIFRNPADIPWIHRYSTSHKLPDVLDACGFDPRRMNLAQVPMVKFEAGSDGASVMVSCEKEILPMNDSYPVRIAAP